MRPLLLAVACATLAPAAHATPWTVDYTKSELTFGGAQAGDPFLGRFDRFTATIDLDPKAPAGGSIAVRIDMASAGIAADKQQNEALSDADWFAPGQFPEATFRSSAIRAVAGGGFEADGTLTIRDHAKPVTLPFTLAPEGAATRARGELTLNRSDFGLGGKQWADDKWIAYPVKVSYSLLATPTQ